MKLFLFLIASLVAASLVLAAAYAAAPGLGVVGWRGGTIYLVGNVSFAIALALFLAPTRSPRLLSAEAALAVLAFLICVAGLVYLGLHMFDRWRTAALLLISPVGTIGAYPAGADMPFDYGIRTWAATALVPIGLGLVLGAAARKVRRTQPGF